MQFRCISLHSSLCPCYANQCFALADLYVVIRCHYSASAFAALHFRRPSLPCFSVALLSTAVPPHIIAVTAPPQMRCHAFLSRRKTALLYAIPCLCVSIHFIAMPVHDTSVHCRASALRPYAFQSLCVSRPFLAQLCLLCHSSPLRRRAVKAPPFPAVARRRRAVKAPPCRAYAKLYSRQLCLSTRFLPKSRR